MKKALRIGFVFIMCIIGTGTLFALTDTADHDVTVTVVEVAAIRCLNGVEITLDTVAPLTAGDPVTGESTDCHREGISGNCGLECPVLLAGYCDEEESMYDDPREEALTVGERNRSMT